MRGINIEWVDWHGEKSCVVTRGKSLQNSLETLKSQQLFLIIPGEMAKKNESIKLHSYKIDWST